MSPSERDKPQDSYLHMPSAERPDDPTPIDPLPAVEPIAPTATNLTALSVGLNVGPRGPISAELAAINKLSPQQVYSVLDRQLELQTKHLDMQSAHIARQLEAQEAQRQREHELARCEQQDREKNRGRLERIVYVILGTLVIVSGALVYSGHGELATGLLRDVVTAIGYILAGGGVVFGAQRVFRALGPKPPEK